MDNKKVNSTEQNPNSSDTFKSTNIYASKANKKADYFAHVKPTLREKMQTKAKNQKAARAAKAQDPAVQKRRHKIAIGILVALIVAVLAVIAWFIYLNFIQPAIEEQQAREERTAIQEGSEEEPNTVASIKQRATELAQSDSPTALEDAINLVNNYLAEVNDPEVRLGLQMTVGELKAVYGDAEQGINELLALDNGQLDVMNQYLLYETIASAYHAIDNEGQADVYHQKALTIRDAANQNQELEKHGL